MGSRFVVFLLFSQILDVFHAMDVKIGLQFPHDSISRKFLLPKMGFSTSAGAVPVALERVEKEQLLPGVNISVDWQFSQCDESQATGLAIEQFRTGAIDVMIGPPCSTPAVLVGVVANFYNVPQLSWAATALELADPVRYPTLTRVIGSAKRLGRALMEILLYFGWTRVAIFYTDDKATRKCLSVAQGAFYFLGRANIHIVYFLEIDGEVPTDQDIDIFFNHFPKLTRIALVCIDQDADIRRFLLRAGERGCASEEFVYLLPDYVRFENQTDVWTDRSEATDTSGRDIEARGAFQNALFMEMLLSSNEELFAFKKRIVQAVTGWPFYYNLGQIDEKYGSIYSPFLHDAVYLYALALNKTLEQGGNKTDGRLIMENSKHLHFQGVSGHVVIDEVAGREPTFVVKGFTKDLRLTKLLKAEMYKKEGNVGDGNTVTLLVPKYALWETRNGYAPTWYPRCGWTGDLCKADTSSYVPFIVVGVALLAVLLVAGIIGGFVLYRNKILYNEMAQMLWKIESRNLQKLTDMQTDGSLATIATNVSEDIAEIVLKGNENVAHYRSQLVWLKIHNVSVVLSNKTDHMQMKMLRDISHDNLNPFIGLCLDGAQPTSVWGYAGKGSLQDVLCNSQLRIDFFFKYAMIRDLVSGMAHLHESGLNSHGTLKSTNCLINSRWVLLITDFGLPVLTQTTDIKIADRLWSAPELLRMENPPTGGTQAGDIYSFSIVLGEILTRDLPFGSYNKLPQEIVNLVRAGLNPPFRPDVKNQNDADMDPGMMTLMQDCWQEDANQRPDFKRIKSAVKQMSRGREGTLLDHAMKIMERHANNMEQNITDQTKRYTDEVGKADVIVNFLLPKHMAEDMKNGLSIEPEAYDSMSIMLSTIGDFNKIIAKSNPVQIINMLSDMQFQLEEIIDGYESAFKVSTVNDMYLIAFGVHESAAKAKEANSASKYHSSGAGEHHACTAANMALHFQMRVGRYYMAHLPDMKCQLQISIHTGPGVAGVQGNLSNPKFLLLGEVVNTGLVLLEHGKDRSWYLPIDSSHREESIGGTIHISENTNAYLTEIFNGYVTKPRGEVQSKDSGVFFTHWLLGKKTKGIDDKTSASIGSSGSGGTSSKG